MDLDLSHRGIYCFKKKNVPEMCCLHSSLPHNSEDINRLLFQSLERFNLATAAGRMDYMGVQTVVYINDRNWSFSSVLAHGLKCYPKHLSTSVHLFRLLYAERILQDNNNNNKTLNK